MARNKKTFDKALVEDLAYKGFKNRDIADSTGVSTSFIYDNKEFLACIKRGRSRLREELADSIQKKAVDMDDTTMQIFLAKRLGMYEKDTPHIKLKGANDALAAFEEVFNADIGIEAKTALKGVLESFTRTFETQEIEKRVDELEKQFEVKR